MRPVSRVEFESEVIPNLRSLGSQPPWVILACRSLGLALQASGCTSVLRRVGSKVRRVVRQDKASKHRAIVKGEGPIRHGLSYLSAPLFYRLHPDFPDIYSTTKYADLSNTVHAKGPNAEPTP